MHLFDQRLLGILVLVLLGGLVVVKRMATGSVLDRPRGNFLIQLVNGFNLFFLLMVNPLEEDGLRKVYGEQYGAYRQKAKKLIPLPLTRNLSVESLADSRRQLKGIVRDEGKPGPPARPLGQRSD